MVAYIHGVLIHTCTQTEVNHYKKVQGIHGAGLDLNWPWPQSCANALLLETLSHTLKAVAASEQWVMPDSHSAWGVRACKTPEERTVKCCPPRGGWQLGAVQYLTHARRQSRSSRLKQACVYKYPINISTHLQYYNFRVAAVLILLTLLYKNSNTKLSRKRHPTPSKDMMNELNQTYHSERAELAPWRVEVLSHTHL